MSRAVLTCLLSVLLSVGSIFYLISEQGLALPGNPFARLVDEASPKYSIAMKTSRALQGPQAPSEPQESPEIERALLPLREALKQPRPSIARINALIALNTIMADYAVKNKSYPSSNMKMVPAAGALAILKDPEFEKHVPVSIINEMQYVSDGKSYKIIVIGSGDCAVVHVLRPAMIDPKRSAGDLDCIAYGVWTPQGREF